MIRDQDRIGSEKFTEFDICFLLHHDFSTNVTKVLSVSCGKTTIREISIQLTEFVNQTSTKIMQLIYIDDTTNIIHMKV